MRPCAVVLQGWVQSYGSRYVRPPIIHGDVTFTKPMTVREYAVAQQLTTKPVKGMLTGELFEGGNEELGCIHTLVGWRDWVWNSAKLEGLWNMAAAVNW